MLSCVQAVPLICVFRFNNFATVHGNMSASHEYLCTLIQNGDEYIL